MRRIRIKLTQLPNRLLSGRTIAPRIRKLSDESRGKVSGVGGTPIKINKLSLPFKVKKNVAISPVVTGRRTLGSKLERRIEARKAKLPLRPGAIEPPKHKEFIRPMALRRRGVPNPQALRREDYEALFSTDRDVSPARPQGGQNIIIGPTSLNHEGRLRKTGKVSGHWAMYAYLVNIDGTPTLGVQFINGRRFFYPGTGESDYHAIVNAESGSYYVWDHLMGRPYSGF